MTPETFFSQLLHDHTPDAIAHLSGNNLAPSLYGTVKFYDTNQKGVLIAAEIFNLPTESSFYAMHIHEYGDCTPPFDKTGNHYNPTNQKHPMHSGDLSPILSNWGYGYLCMFTNRFTIKEILGKSFVIHNKPDDFVSQPAGNAGEKIGCGVIVSLST